MSRNAWFGNSALFRVLIIYSLRAVSGIGTLLAILLVGHFYTSAELASYSVFMFLFNLVTIVFLWGDTVTAVDNYNANGSDAPISIGVGYKMLDGIAVLLFFFFGLQYFGYWNYGLIGSVPVGLTALLAALLVVKKKIIAASFCFEFSRAVIPFVIMVAIIFSPIYIEFDWLMITAYSSFWLGVPLLFGYVKKERLWRTDFSFSVKGWLKSKQEGLSIVMPQIILILVFQADRLFINYWGDVEELASYFAAQTLYTIVLVAVHSTFNLVIPETSKVASMGGGDMRGAGRAMLAAQVGASAIIIPMAYVYLDYISVDKAVAMQAMLLLMTGGILSACFGIGLPALQFCKSKGVYLKVVFVGMILQFLVIGFGYSPFGLYSVVLGFMVYNIYTSMLAAWFWRKNAVAINPFSFAKL